ncbi:MAG: methyltransferase domain-containing protein [Acidobacteriota bacterium]|nr:methyltransferase domain-containing protein [Blastocatellia bacterium]MDW8241371.1 methyltransferase domain-containing protein [Acidobacteriota bacterium]
MPSLFPNFSQRSAESEIMDGTDFSEEEIRGAYDDLQRVNRFLGGTRALLRHALPLIERLATRPVSVLDLGSGSADIPRALVQAARHKRIPIHIVALDANPHAIRAATEQLEQFPEIDVVQADALRWPFPDGSFDLVIASEFLHHLSDEDAVWLLRHARRLARVALLINDLRRHPLAYYSFWMLSRMFTRNRLIRHDGLVSILRGFTADDLARIRQHPELADLAVHFHFPYRIVFIGMNQQTGCTQRARQP